jgi:acyl carrier protein
MDTEKIVMDILSDVVRKDNILSEENILDMGIDSFQILCIAMKIESTFCVQLPLDKINRSTNPRTIARLIDCLKAEKSSPCAQ